MDLNKRVGFEVTVAFRNKLICKNCQVFPRLDVALFRCASCGQFLCQKCIGSVKSKCCPICQRSKAYFIRQTEIMEIVAGFKTHPCINLKNGCHEDIPAKDEELKSHDQSCVFQLVTCPTLDCDESIIFKNLDQHLKESHFNAAMSVYCGTKTNECPENFGTFVYGIYHRQLGELINGRYYYEKKATGAGCKYGIWFSENGEWMLGKSKDKGKPTRAFAKIKRDFPFPEIDWEWMWKNENIGDWKQAMALRFWNKGPDGPCGEIKKVDLRVKVLSFSLAQEWEFNGTKEELLSSCCLLKFGDQQFYPQFKEVNKCLVIRTLMLGFQTYSTKDLDFRQEVESIPFEVSITFFLKDGKQLPPYRDIVYPITEEKETIFETSSIHCHLEKITKYYDIETKEYKNQSKINFKMKIISRPKLDNDEKVAAKNRNVECIRKTFQKFSCSDDLSQNVKKEDRYEEKTVDDDAK